MPRATALVLEADDAIARDVARQLSTEGLSVVSCQSAGSLRQRLTEHHAEVCLIGARLPDEDALSLIRNLRMTTRTGLIVLGDSNEEVDTVLALEMGADDYLVKPVRMRELAARTRSVIRRIIALPKGVTGDVAARKLPDDYLRRLGDLEICGITREVTRCGQPVELTTLEFDVLMVLCSAVNSVLSRARIIEVVHGRQWNASDRTVDGIISRLRRKLFDGEEGNKRIRTLHRRGYMLVDYPQQSG